MIAKPVYEYQVGSFHLNSREAARIVKRSLKKQQPDVQIIQRTITEKVIR